MISGTSAGVLTSLNYCAGMTPQFAIDCFAKDLKPRGIYSILPKGAGFYMLAKFRNKSWDKMLRKYLFDWRLEQCPIPGFAVATDLVQSRQVIRGSGDIVHAILESINLPVLSPPICRDGMALVDGGILNVLPADVLVNHGCSFVIGVNVSAKIKPEFAGNTPETPTAKMKIPGVMATLLRTLTVLDQNMSAIGANAADFTIEPDVSDMDMAAFEKAPLFAEIGRKETESKIPDLKQMLHRLDDKLFL
jgi:NTE family protein